MAEEEKAVEAAETETLGSFDKIEIPEDVLKAADEGKILLKAEEDESDKEKEVETETTDETDEDQEQDEESTFAIDAEGKEKFTSEQIKKWREDSVNSEAFIKSATDKTKEVSELRKSLDPVIGLVKKLKDAGEKVTEIKEYLSEELGIGGEVIDAALAFEEGKFDDPLKEELKTEKAARKKSDAKLALIEDKHDFCKRHKVNMDVADKVHDYALAKNDEKGVLYTLDDAYDLMEKIPKLEKQIEKLKSESKPKVEITKLPDKKKGATKIAAKKPETFEDLKESVRKTSSFKQLEEEIGS